MVGCVYSYQVWEKIEKCFVSQTRAKITQLKLYLHSIKKRASMNSYLLDIKKTVDQLIVVGAIVTTEEHIQAILDGLPADYTPLVTSIISRLDPYSIEEMVALLLQLRQELNSVISSSLAPRDF